MAVITLTSSDAQSFSVDRDLLKHAVAVEAKLKNGDASQPIAIEDVDGATLQKVITWLKQHQSDPAWVEKENPENRCDDVPEWDKEFLKDAEQQTLYALTIAADKMDIGGLMEVTCKTIAGHLNGKTAVEMGEWLGIECDHTPEELAEIRKENEWCEK